LKVVYTGPEGKKEYRLDNIDDILTVDYPQIKEDLPVLIKNGVIKKDESGYCWNYSYTSLAQYFKYRIFNKKPLCGMCKTSMPWAVVEDGFNIKRGTLKHLVSTNGRPPETIRPLSKDYEKILSFF
jgi:hypothetical protein